MFSLFFIPILIFSFFTLIDSTWFCINESCSEPISKAKATVFRPREKWFEPNIQKGDEILVYGYSNSSQFYLIKKNKDDNLSKMPVKFLKTRRNDFKKCIPISDSLYRSLIPQKFTKLLKQPHGISSCYTEFLNIILPKNVCDLPENKIEPVRIINDTTSTIFNETIEAVSALNVSSETNISNTIEPVKSIINSSKEEFEVPNNSSLLIPGKNISKNDTVQENKVISKNNVELNEQKVAIDDNLLMNGVDVSTENNEKIAESISDNSSKKNTKTDFVFDSGSFKRNEISLIQEEQLNMSSSEKSPKAVNTKNNEKKLIEKKADIISDNSSEENTKIGFVFDSGSFKRNEISLTQEEQLNMSSFEKSSKALSIKNNEEKTETVSNDSLEENMEIDSLSMPGNLRHDVNAINKNKQLNVNISGVIQKSLVTEINTTKSFAEEDISNRRTAKDVESVSNNHFYRENSINVEKESVPMKSTVQQSTVQSLSQSSLLNSEVDLKSAQMDDFRGQLSKITPSYSELETNMYDIIGNKDKIKEEIPFGNAVIEKEESFYEVIFDYLSNFSESYFCFDWLKKYSFWKSQHWQVVLQSEENCEDSAECSLKDGSILIGSSKAINVPFWGFMDKDIIMMYIGVFLSILLIFISILYLILSSKKSKNVNTLIGIINQLEKKLLVATKEIIILKEKITHLEDKEIEIVGARNDEFTDDISEQVQHFQQRNTELEDKLAYLEKELEIVSTSALEMHTLLENSLVTQANSELARNEVDVLRTLTESQGNQIIELRDEMDSILLVNQTSFENNEVLKSSMKKLEIECNSQIKKNLELTEKNRDLTLLLDKQIESNSSLESNYKSELYQLRSKLDDMEMNLKRAEFQIEELNRAFMDKFENFTLEEVQVLKLKIQISTLEAVNNDLTVQLKTEKSARRMLDEHVGDVIKELNKLKNKFEIIEKERNEAVTKLTVLTDYFKEKETELHKELEVKEKLVGEIENKDQSLNQKLASLKEEINNYKLRNEKLEKEILEQEISYKMQLANAEQNARDRWFELRQSERKYQETEKEAANLRNKILILETSLSSVNQKSDEKANMINGGGSTIYHPPMSPDLLPYPVPPEFMPLPPLPITSHSMEFLPPEPLYSPDERLPPLGGRRVPSPPPLLMPDDDDFAPPLPDVKYMRGRNRNELSSSYLRTLTPTSLHRSQYKARQQRNSLDSPSSGMSVESLDRSGR